MENTKTIKTVAIDVGNTCIKISEFKKNGFNKIHYFNNQTFKDNCNQIIRITKGSLVYIGSVNDKTKKELIKNIDKQCKKIINVKKTNTNNLNSYYDKNKIGLDRIANLYAALTIFKAKNIIIIDAGTTITIDVIKNRIHVGGYILPNIKIIKDSLIKRTEKIKLNKKISYKKNIIPDTTESAVEKAGILTISGAIKEIIKEIKNITSHKNYKILCTGGSIEFIKKLNIKYNYISYLTLMGIYKIGKNKKGRL